jgi:hypothetical protein
LFIVVAVLGASIAASLLWPARIEPETGERTGSIFGSPRRGRSR